MKKIMLLAAAILSLSSVPANAGGSFSLNLFAPAPVYVDYPPPPPRYVVYPASYRHVYYDRWERPVYVKKQCRKHKKQHPHWRDHDDDDDDRVYGRTWRDSGDYYRRW